MFSRESWVDQCVTRWPELSGAEQVDFAFAVTCSWYKLLPLKPLGPRFLYSRWVGRAQIEALCFSLVL